MCEFCPEKKRKKKKLVDCGLWNVGPFLFNGCAKFLDIGKTWNPLLYADPEHPKHVHSC